MANPFEPWNSVLSKERARNFYGVRSGHRGVYTTWGLAILASIEMNGSWEITGFETYEEAYAYSMGYSIVQMSQNEAVLEARDTYNRKTYEFPQVYHIPDGIPVLAGLGKSPHVPPSEILSWDTNVAEEYFRVFGVPMKSSQFTMPARASATPIHTPFASPSVHARTTQTQHRAMNTVPPATRTPAGKPNAPAARDAEDPFISVGINALHLGPSEPSRKDKDPRKASVFDITQSQSPKVHTSGGSKPRTTSTSHHILGLGPSIVKPEGSKEKGRSRDIGVKLDHHMKSFLSLYHHFNKQQLRFILETLASTPTSLFGSIKASKPKPGSKYMIADIEKHAIRPLMALGMDSNQAWHFAKWVFGIGGADDVASDSDGRSTNFVHISRLQSSK